MRWFNRMDARTRDLLMTEASERMMLCTSMRDVPPFGGQWKDLKPSLQAWVCLVYLDLRQELSVPEEIARGST